MPIVAGAFQPTGTGTGTTVMIGPGNATSNIAGVSLDGSGPRVDPSRVNAGQLLIDLGRICAGEPIQITPNPGDEADRETSQPKRAGRPSRRHPHRPPADLL